MIIEADTTTVVSNMPAGMVTEMTISVDGMAHLMKTLTNLYNDPMLAVIREYFANGLDSHVMAGNTDPVLVSLPDSYNKMFVVQDFGVGMSVEDITDIYSKYGASTKRQSNDQIGAYGLGAKSALAIANQFTVVSVKDGVKATVLVQKAEGGINTMSVVSVIDTDEPNGVTVSIPVDNTYAFNNKARDFFRFVDPGLVLVDGSAPASVFATATEMEISSLSGATAYINLNESYGTSYVIMGQVAYALTTSDLSNAAERLGRTLSYELRNMPVYFKVGIGDVDLTPNREGLRFTDKTNTVIDGLVEDYLLSIEEKAQEEIDAVDSRDEVYDVVDRWHNRLGMRLQWHGEDVLYKISTKTPSSTIKRTTWDKSTHGSAYEISLLAADGYQRIIVTGQPFDKYRRMSNYITDYLAMEDMANGARFYFREALDELDNDWLKENPKFILEDFEDMIQRVKDYRKAERAAAKALLPQAERERRGKIKYPVILDVEDQNSMTTLPYDELPTDAFYLHADDVNHLAYKAFFSGEFPPKGRLSMLKDLVGEGASIIFIAKGRSLESFKARTKDLAGLRHISEAAPEAQARIDELMTEEAVVARDFRLNHSANRLLQRFDREYIDRILDDEIRNQLMPVDEELKGKADAAYDIYYSICNLHMMGVEVTIPTFSVERVEVDAAEKYPLTRLLSLYPAEEDQDHMVQYMNMIYTNQLTLVDA